MILILVLSIISAILYRAGGMSKDTKHWIPLWLRHSWVRDYLCPICALAPIFVQSWWVALAYGLSVSALSTYWDWMFKEDNFWMAGFGCGLAFLPLLFCGFDWLPIVLRAVFLALSWGIICKYSDNDFVEEYSRGFTFSVATILFIFQWASFLQQ